jgi:hypothetical protein
MKYVFAGNSWAHKDFTEDNYNLANREFAKYLKEQVYTWLGKHNVKK